ncbi:type IX secretion system membrane protein PorP/SprF [Flavobacterium sp.]|uniref:PorP/SprF family type IX secretion system membrane protein n=1 Tax=Flavobacterium sp. TaxID=239 RepID=UPI0035270C1D
MKIKPLLFLIAFLLGIFKCVSQQDSQYTQYLYNTVNYNPAYAGNRGVVTVFGLHRAQWVGLAGAPETSVFSINAPIHEKNIGLGLSFVADKVGPSTENNISIDFAYTLPMNDDFNLSFGIKGALSELNIDYTKLHVKNETDIYFQNNINTFIPNVGVGFYLFSDQLFAGVSVPNILEANYYDDNDPSVIATKRSTFYFIGGYVFDWNNDIKMKPSLIGKMVNGAPFQLDVSTNVQFYDNFVIGASWRWSAAISGMVGFQLTNNWFIGYAYDADTTSLTNYNSGSHEIFLRYDFVSTKRRISNPHRLKCFCAE